MTFYLIIRGPLGVGKSTISKQLAKDLGAEYISIDKILSEHDLAHSDGKCIPEKNFIKANELVLSKVKNFLNKGIPVIFDGNFYHYESINHLIENLEGQHYVFTLDAPLDVCIARDKERGETHGAVAATAVHNLVSEVRYGQTIETENKTINEIVAEIKKFL
ncbi:hypothetical protein COV11_01420 [Candidatus Woesearchaeota archaeon CG10_big_fil_rev_8_21_14_0_10_30_7]|nr:MAG: hypothetical protein COV11_01420 [Candidatus Woesearchaeota archaeon CG10_big_fil_rev_8_21_14_0_10_30_7]